MTQPQPKPLFALTLAQPWPAMMLLDDQPKRVENRIWSPPRKLVGHHIALHGGRLPKTPKELEDARTALEWVDTYVFDDADEPWDEDSILKVCVQGIYAVARIKEVVSHSDDPWFMGPFGWVLEDFVAIEPVPCRGGQKLWAVEGDLLSEVRRRWLAARRKASPVVDELPAPVAETSPPADLPPPLPLPEHSSKPKSLTRKEREDAAKAAKAAREKAEKAVHVAHLLLLTRLRGLRDPYFLNPAVIHARRAGLQELPLAELRVERRSTFARRAYQLALPDILAMLRWRHQRLALPENVISDASACYAESIPAATEQQAKGKPSAQVSGLLFAEGVHRVKTKSVVGLASPAAFAYAQDTRPVHLGQPDQVQRVPGATP